MNGEFSEHNDPVISADVLVEAAGLMNESLHEKVHAELAPCTNDQFVQRYCQLDPGFADTMYGEFNIDVSDIHQEKIINAALSPTARAQNELRDALMGDRKSFIALLKEYGNDCALEKTEGLDRNAELYRFDSMGYLEGVDKEEVIYDAIYEFDDFCDWASEAELEYIGAYGTVSDDIKHAIANYQDAVGKSGGEQSLDEILEQKVEVAGDSEIGDEMSVSNGER